MANTAATQATIGNGQTLNADAARYWAALVARIKAETGFTIVATEGTRLYERQKYLWDGYRSGRIDPSTGRRFNPAWPPDSPSAYHLSGRAVDVGSSVGYVTTEASRAFYSRAGQYGFRPTVAGEPWHFEFRPEWVGVTLETAVLAKAIIPAPDSPREDDMLIHLRGSAKRGEALVGPGHYHSLTPEEARYVSLLATHEVDARGNDRVFDLVRNMLTATSK